MLLSDVDSGVKLHSPIKKSALRCGLSYKMFWLLVTTHNELRLEFSSPIRSKLPAFRFGSDILSSDHRPLEGRVVESARLPKPALACVRPTGLLRQRPRNNFSPLFVTITAALRAAVWIPTNNRRHKCQLYERQGVSINLWQTDRQTANRATEHRVDTTYDMYNI